ncbi:MAG: carboxylate--amine ligase [Desulfobacteraceae bacterium]|nr:acetate--CoA ligase family protein [Desulfobacteraceae bacterium]MBC2754507.1 carboxylate--amine ligase [Desulfobacteraceae bacterium]
MNIIEKAASEGKTTLSEYESKQVLSAYQIPVTREFLVYNEKDLIKAARKIGYPLVVKGCDALIAHKTEKNLIRTAIDSEKKAITAFNDIQAGMTENNAAVIVQEMIIGRRELVAGLIRDHQFGPSVMFGIGGIFTEIFNDVTFRIAPLNRQDAFEMMDEIRGKRILGAIRGMKDVDREQLSDILIRIGQIGIENKMIQEIDINPIIISKGKGIVVDAMIVLESS